MEYRHGLFLLRKITIGHTFQNFIALCHVTTIKRVFFQHWTTSPNTIWGAGGVSKTFKKGLKGFGKVLKGLGKGILLFFLIRVGAQRNNILQDVANCKSTLFYCTSKSKQSLQLSDPCWSYTQERYQITMKHTKLQVQIANARKAILMMGGAVATRLVLAGMLLMVKNSNALMAPPAGFLVSPSTTFC